MLFNLQNLPWSYLKTVQNPQIKLPNMSQTHPQTIQNLLPNKSTVEKRYIEKLDLSEAPTEEQKAALIKDPEFLAELMMASCPLTFIEMFGYIFFSSNSENYSNLAKRILKESDLKEVYEKKDFVKLANKIGNNQIESNDLFTATYKMWNAIWSEFASSGTWRTELLSNSSRPSFGYGLDNRKNLLKRVDEFNQLASSVGISKPWSLIFDKSQKILGSFDNF